MPTAFDIGFMFALDNSPTTGSYDSILGRWLGTATSRGMTVVFTNNDNDTASLQSGSWFGSTSNFGNAGATLENHDKSHVVSDEAPNVAEGINLGEYNPFPIPTEPEPEVETQKARDATRFQKSYSFSRNQPVRTRVYKR